jgi:hypothetical protein
MPQIQECGCNLQCGGAFSVVLRIEVDFLMA